MAVRLVADVRHGNGGLAWFWGEAGIGKTALVSTFLVRAAELGCTVFRGSGDELTTPLPLLPVTDALRIEPATANAEELLALVRERCAAGPVVLALEDLQWADDATLLLWNRLARAVTAERLPLLLIGTARPWPRRGILGTLTDLVTRRAGAVVGLEPLGATDVAALAGQLTGAPCGPKLRAVLDWAGGNPGYLRDLIETLVDQHLIDVADGKAELARSAGDAGVIAAAVVAVRAGCGDLPAELRAALRVAALLETRFSATEWAAAAGRGIAEITVLASAAIDARILRADGNHLEFRHEMVRQALAAEIPPALRGAAHAEIARLLAQAGRPAGETARHLLAGPTTLAPWVTRWLAELPDAALYTRPAAFTELLARVIATVPEDGDLRQSLSRRSGITLFWLGRDEEALATAVAVTARTRDPAMLVLAVRAALRLGRPEHALQVAAQYSLSPERPTPLWHARLTAWLAQATYGVDGPGSGETLAKEALNLAIQSGDPLSIAYAQYALAECGDAAAEIARLREAMAAIHGRDPESTEMLVLLSASHLRAVMRCGVPAAEAEAALADALAAGEQAGADRAGPIQVAAAEFCYLRGRWDEALTHAAPGDSPFAAKTRRGIAALIALRRGDRAAADAWLAGPDALTGNGQGSSPALLTRALALSAEASGDLEAAVRILRCSLGWRPALRSHDEMPYLVRVALLAGDRDSARDASNVAAADLASDASPGWSAAARCCEALLADDVPALLAVADDYMSFGWLPAAAIPLEEAAVRLAASGDAAGARAALTDAVRCYTDSKATWDVRRIDARLRAYGVRRGPRSVHKRAATGWAALTPAELRVASMLQRGASNADIAAELIVSRRTVHTHVSHILRKLGASSRIDLMREPPGTIRNGMSRREQGPVRPAQGIGRFPGHPDGRGSRPAEENVS